MEASALPASAGLTRARLGLGAPLLRLRPDEQLVSLFRAGNEDAFRVIHDRYRARMLAYARQMLASSSADAEDAVQEIFVRAYAGLRANQRDLALRAWLYRIAHNRCVDELRRPRPLAVEAVEDLREAPGPDPHARVEQREALRRLIVDVQHLPEQQRSALLMRELGGMPYADLAGALGVSVPAVKSLLVRARVGLAQASEARDTACASIREDLVVAHDRGVRANGRARRHMRDCTDCRHFRTEVQGMSHNLGLLIPALGPLAVAAKLIGLGGIGGGGSAAAGSGTGAAAGATATAAGATGTAAGATGTAAAGGSAVAAGGSVVAGGSAVAGATGTAAAVTGTSAAAGGTVAATATAGAAGAAGAAASASTGALATAGAAAGTAHVATLLAATAIAAGGAIGIQHEVSAAHRPARVHHAIALAAVSRGSAALASGAPSAPTKATVRTPDPVSTSAATAAGVTSTSRTPATNATTRTALAAKSTTTAATQSSAASPSASGVTSLASNTGVPATATSATTSAPAVTDPTTTATTTTTDPTTPPVTSTVPTSTDPMGTDPASTDPTTTAPATTPADPTTTTPVTATPIAGAATGDDPVTSTTAVTTIRRDRANPGTATGIVPTTVNSATTWASGRSWRRIRLQTWRDAPRGVAAGWTTVQR